MSSVAFNTGAEPIPGYRLLDRLGSGGFGEVWRCEAPGGIQKAVKVIHGDLRYKDNDAYRFAEQELKSLKRVKQVRHPYLVALDRFDIVEGRLVIVMELADCNLWDRFRQCREAGQHGIPREELLGYMAEAAEVLDLMNDRYQLQHLDIKPQNLFLLYNHVKVADFGQVKDLEKHVAQVTGGITPVYAAPETFDGFVSRYCDQYSLACVYQELLTGVRPFDGSSMNQLLMQHLSHAPNLDPSPAADRPALARALSKKAEDRFPSVSELVAALRSGSAARPSASLAGVVAVGGAAGVEEAGTYSFADSYPPSPNGTAGASTGVFAPESTPYPRAVPVPVSPPERDPLPERTGPGPLRPALVIGLGYAGRRALQRFTRLLAEEGGSARRLPHVRTLYIDTHPDAVAGAANPTEPEFAPLSLEHVLHTPLNRAAHYLRPRNNGRAVIEGWFDPNVLYRMPRVPSTGGVRSLGRLALCDHHRGVVQRVQTEIDLALDPGHLAAASAVTGKPIRTNRPRVYLVAGLGGGTGGGMLIDLAYLVRQQLRRVGYTDPDVVGILLAPPAGGNVSQMARANTYAALTELHHFSRPETAFVSTTDEGELIRDNDPPFTRTVFLAGYEYEAEGSITQTQLPRRKSGGSSTANLKTVTRENNRPDPAANVAEYLRFDLFTPVGRAADDIRGDRTNAPTVAAVGGCRFTWPRHAVVVKTARVLAPVLVGQWVTAEQGQPVADYERWADERWAVLGLNPDDARRRLRGAADASLGEPVDAHLRRTFDTLAPKGWLAKLPDPAQVSAAVGRMVTLFGPPRETPGRGPGPLAQAISAESDRFATDAVSQLAELIPALLDAPGFRLNGAEEVARRLLILAERQNKAVRDAIPIAEAQSATAFDRLLHYTTAHKGVNKPTAAELSDALRDYPDSGYDAAVSKQLAEVYSRVLDALVARLNDLATCRRRLEECHDQLVALADAPLPPANPEHLHPPGCSSVEDAAKRYLASLDDHDLNEAESRFQKRVGEELGGVYEASMNSADGPQRLLRLLRDTTHDYLHERLGEVDLSAMMKAKFGSPSAVAEALDKGYAAATPAVSRGPWAKGEICVFGAPSGAGGVGIHHAAGAILPPAATIAQTSDEVVIYREWPQVPLASLDQLGPVWEAAYRTAPELTQTTAHTRTDITSWLPVDG
ncbi:MAG: protein kinase [Fimbriiglobus sp.]|nr:protein kinase [Fimbriiglobus sp.]